MYLRKRRGNCRDMRIPHFKRKLSKFVLIASAACAVLLISALWMRVRSQISDSVHTSELNYILTEERGAPSFDPVHSDTLLNVTFMEQLVGTLVKYAWDG